MNCGKEYKHKQSLSRHKHACGYIKKICCPHCPHRTNRKDNLKIHIYHKHGDFMFKDMQERTIPDDS